MIHGAGKYYHLNSDCPAIITMVLVYVKSKWYLL